MSRKSSALLAGVVLLISTQLKASTPKWSFNAVEVGDRVFPHRYGDLLAGEFTQPHAVIRLGKLILFRGPLGIGTTAAEHVDFYEYVAGYTYKADTTFEWWIERLEFTSYLPVIVNYMFHFESLGVGNLNIHSYLKFSLWPFSDNGAEEEDEHYYEYYDEYGRRLCFYNAYRAPSSYFDLGICLCLNPLKLFPCWLQLGIIRLDYRYHRPDSFKRSGVHIPRTVTRLYASYGVALGWQ